MTEQPSQDSARPHARGGKRALLLLLGLVVGWTLLMRQFNGADVYGVMGPYSLTVSASAWLLRSRALARWLKPTRAAVAIGIGLGVLMTVLTYPVYRGAVQLLPSLRDEVQSLYAATSSSSLPVAMTWVTLIILAEELLWRGVLLDALEHRLTKHLALTLSLLSYALAQLGTGSWVVFLLALVCGGVWSVQRKLTGSLLAPLLSHFIWTQSVILIWPVT